MKNGVASPWPILIDFGLAHDDSEDRLTPANDAVGNARFSPDIMRRRVAEVLPWLDVFYLAQILIWMLDEEPPKAHWRRGPGHRPAGQVHSARGQSLPYIVNTPSQEGVYPFSGMLRDSDRKTLRPAALPGEGQLSSSGSTPVIDDNCPAGASRPFHKRGVWNRAKRLSFPC